VLEAAELFDVPMPVAGLVRDRLLAGIARGYQDKDLAALALICAEDAELVEPPPGMNAQNARQ